MAPTTGFETVPRLDRATVTELAVLLEDVTEHDGLRPLSGQVWLHVKEGGEEHGLHVLARAEEGQLVGYAHIDVTDEVEGASAELTVSPSRRRAGIGRQLIETLLLLSPDGRLRLWSHGEQAGATALAERMGFHRSRVLWQMRRSLYAPVPRAVVPDDIVIRAFRVGLDEEAWLDLNARAFPHLPDQGSWTRKDLERRLHEPWFSADGFLMAWRGEQLVGFHWTKVHGGGGHGHGHHHDPFGEVYVVAVDPQERGTGLGRTLTLLGLNHLRSLDLDQAMLYVDASNTAAISLYEGLGFARWDTDVLYRR
jgi:mycothiol synthase